MTSLHWDLPHTMRCQTHGKLACSSTLDGAQTYSRGERLSSHRYIRASHPSVPLSHTQCVCWEGDISGETRNCTVHLPVKELFSSLEFPLKRSWIKILPLIKS
ncbi:gap junction alpha-3 protein [Sarotherodon galilaeus]